MRNIFIIATLILSIAIGVYAQEETKTEPEKKEEAKTETAPTSSVDDRVYSEITLEDFEKGNYSSKNVSIRIVTKDQKVGAKLRTDFPAPTRNSKKYLGVKIYGRHGDVVTIKPPTPILIKDHCQSISVWVYGKNFTGELSIVLQDGKLTTHRLSLGKLNFLGWRKLNVKLSKNVAQEDKHLAQARSLKILKLIYNPGNRGRLGTWNYFYIDDITAQVRKKYLDKQSDEW